METKIPKLLHPGQVIASWMWRKAEPYDVAAALWYAARWLQLQGCPEAATGFPTLKCGEVRHQGFTLQWKPEVIDAINRRLLEIATERDLPLMVEELIDLHCAPPLRPVRTAEEKALVEVAFECGNRNPWIREASDPVFDRNSFWVSPNLAALEWSVLRSNMCLGSGFLFENLAFVNQVNGYAELMVVRADAGDFESLTADMVLERNPEYLREFIADIQAASAKELKTLNYVGAASRAKAGEGSVALALSASQFLAAIA